ncbi:hypothetical protein Tco_0269166 [Tanacetum coccineum]
MGSTYVAGVKMIFVGFSDGRIQVSPIIIRELMLEAENEGVKTIQSRMKENMQTTDEELSKISQTLEAIQAENNSLSIKGSELAEEIKINHEKIKELVVECSQLKEKLAEKERAFNSHRNARVSQE